MNEIGINEKMLSQMVSYQNKLEKEILEENFDISKKIYSTTSEIKDNSLAKYCIDNWNSDLAKKIYVEYTGLMPGNTKIQSIKDITYGSRQEIICLCSKCHKLYKASPYKILRGKRCYHCIRNSQAITQSIPSKELQNSFEEWLIRNKDKAFLMNEWTGIEVDKNTKEVKNTNVKTIEVTFGSSRQFKWKCNKCKYIWISSVKDRTDNHNCPVCNGTAYVTEANSLEEYCNKHKGKGDIIREEWTGIEDNTEENKIFDISEIASMSARKFKWKCSNCKKIFSQIVYNRTRNNQGCPYCNTTGTSFPEQYIYYGIKNEVDEVESRIILGKEATRTGRGYEYDIYIPYEFMYKDIIYKGLVIEYNSFWHIGKEKRDKIKREYAEENKLYYLEIYEYISKSDYIDTFDDSLITTYGNQYAEDNCYRLNKIIEATLKIIGKQTKITDEQISIIYKQAYLASHGTIIEEKALSNEKYLSKEFDYNKNNGLTPRNVYRNSNLKIWWKCPKCGHSWKAKPNTRFQGRSGCPECHYNWFKEEAKENE